MAFMLARHWRGELFTPMQTTAQCRAAIAALIPLVQGGATMPPKRLGVQHLQMLALGLAYTIHNQD